MSRADELTAFARRIADPSQPERPAVDAATLLILDTNASGEPVVLMGRRHMRHTFMPGKFVFPGGRVDESDAQTPLLASYHPQITAKLAAQTTDRSIAQLEALAVAACRETYEEAGLFIGKQQEGNIAQPLPPALQAFTQRGLALDLSCYRLLARAVTPPGQPRCFDTRFFVVDAAQIADRLAEGTGPTGELEELQWPTLEECKQLDLPPITLVIIEELQQRLQQDPQLDPATPIPFYFWQDGFQRKLL
ncbi:NUDIX hydrolase [Polycladidibacter hongkongensis]|uniref:NUDIX hydrolase n=1 Tax=Polycladidibacter hongkongensis TaxID=1647556 RepID=UPI000831F9CA|nr:NUDIX domain-containing protein [Pseudovibrio hongkongensis]